MNNDNWYTTIGGFLFLVLMLALMVVCCSCSKATPPDRVVVRSEVAEMAEATYRRNVELEKLAREK